MLEDEPMPFDLDDEVFDEILVMSIAQQEELGKSLHILEANVNAYLVSLVTAEERKVKTEMEVMAAIALERGMSHCQATMVESADVPNTLFRIAAIRRASRIGRRYVTTVSQRSGSRSDNDITQNSSKPTNHPGTYSSSAATHLFSTSQCRSPSLRRTPIRPSS